MLDMEAVMSKLNKLGYISLSAGVVFLAIAFAEFGMYEESLMIKPFFCISSVCLSRADIFFPAFLVGYLLLALGLALLGEHIISNLKQIVFRQVIY